MKCKRKECPKEVREKGGLYFANKLAIDAGYCSYVCFLIEDEEGCGKAMMKHIAKIKGMKK